MPCYFGERLILRARIICQVIKQTIMMIAHNRVILCFLNAEHRHDKTPSRVPGNKKGREFFTLSAMSQ